MNEYELYEYELLIWIWIIWILDAVGSWQIILPMPNLEGPYQSNKGSEAVLKCLQYKQCAGPQKISKFRF